MHAPPLQPYGKHALDKTWHVSSMMHMAPTVSGWHQRHALGSTWVVHPLEMPKHQVHAWVLCKICTRLLNKAWRVTSGHHMTPTVMVLVHCNSLGCSTWGAMCPFACPMACMALSLTSADPGRATGLLQRTKVPSTRVLRLGSIRHRQTRLAPHGPRLDGAKTHKCCKCRGVRQTGRADRAAWKPLDAS